MADTAPQWLLDKYAGHWPLDPNGEPEKWQAVMAFEALGKWAAQHGLLRDCEAADG